ncbi:MAG: GlmU family protein [Cytophagales bacterium]
MNILLFDDINIKKALLPFTFTRPVCEIRVGINTIAEKWRNISSNHKISYLTEPYLAQKYRFVKSDINYLVNGSLFPDANLIEAISKLSLGEGLVKHGVLLAVCIDFIPFLEGLDTIPSILQMIDYEQDITILRNQWDIFTMNGSQIKVDFEFISKRTSQQISDKHTIVYNPENIFIEEGAKIKAAVLNAESGPIYIGKNAEIQEGSIVRGPFALCEGAVINMGSKMRGDTTIGPYSKVGGEINNSVILGYSNKAHDGFLGNSVIGEWCNLGADTNTSNLKNNYSNIKVWNYHENDYVDSGRQFCGLMMGDHSKTGINSMFNTGTVVGVNANIFGGGYPPKYIPSYAWGGSEGFQKFDFDKAMQVAAKVMERRNVMMENEDYEILRYIYNS